MSGKLFTSESVTKGHPDKVADQISDAVLDYMLTNDPNARVACETMVFTDTVVIAGEITTKDGIDKDEIVELVRDAVRAIGYTDRKIGFDADTCDVQVNLIGQSPDIAMGVDRAGAGDQGIMFGYACRETESLMPLTIALAHKLTDRLSEARETGEIPWLRPDGKSQVTVEYGADGKPARIHTIVISTQHTEEVVEDGLFTDKAREVIKEKIIMPSLPGELVDENIIYHINPTGKFVVGGPHGDCGLTGRKIIVDTYGGHGSHGGGAFSGKDPSKVDRSASYMARYIAKNIVAAELADECEVQLSYAIGVNEPLSVLIDTNGTTKNDERRIEEIVIKLFPLSPNGIISHFGLKRPIYGLTAQNGHFGNPSFPWEQIDMADKLKAAF